MQIFTHVQSTTICRDCIGDSGAVCRGLFHTMKDENAGIEFVHTTYNVGGRDILRDISLPVENGKILVMLGRSGSGKSTALKLVNRLLVPTTGEVLVEGKSTQQWDPIRLRRHIGYAIQEIGLFPHLTVEQNIALLPTLERWPRERITSRVNELLGLTGLASNGLQKRYPDQLSGGQCQRVGLARALSLDPPMLLMDEPFGALDPLTRSELQREFKRLSASLNKTVIFVTHDANEALLLATRIAVLDDGQLHGVFTPEEFLECKDPAVKPYIDALRGRTEGGV